MYNIEELTTASAGTAIKRDKISQPLKAAIKKELFTKDDTILDYGSGKGFDVSYLESEGYTVTGYDPYQDSQPNMLSDGETYDVVLLSYVLNVIPDKATRDKVFKEAFALADKMLIISLLCPVKGTEKHTSFKDGAVNTRGRFQKFYTGKEFTAYVKEVFPDIKPRYITSTTKVLYK
jgi:DNA phosphorothioation-associated putative methyltransferase